MILASSHASPSEMQRFLKEAEAVAALQHANIVASRRPCRTARRPTSWRCKIAKVACRCRSFSSANSAPPCNSPAGSGFDPVPQDCAMMVELSQNGAPLGIASAGFSGNKDGTGPAAGIALLLSKPPEGIE